MNDLHFPKLTPKKAVFVIVGVVILSFAFLVVFSSLSTARQSSLGLSGTVKMAAAPSMGMFSAGIDEESANYYAADGVYQANTIAVTREMPIPSPSSPPAGDAKIIKSGNLSLLVKNVEETATAISDIRARFGGQVGNASFHEYRPGVKSGNMTIWVPAAKFDDAMTEIKKLALRVENESTNVEDVSAQFVDINARLKNLRSAEDAYVEIMKRSGKISEVLEVTNALNNTRAQIEQLQGQLDYLSRKVALSSISINLSQEAVPTTVTDEWRPMTVAKTALKQTLSGLTDLADMLIVFVIGLPVLVLNIGLWALILLGLWKIARFGYHKVNTAMDSTSTKDVV